MKDKNFKIVYETWDSVKLYMVKHLLERAGVEVRVFDEHISSLIPSPVMDGAGFGTMKIAVSGRDLERALQAIEDFLRHEKSPIKIYSPDDDVT